LFDRPRGLFENATLRDAPPKGTTKVIDMSHCPRGLGCGDDLLGGLIEVWKGV
jgi:hypothetical protein